MKKNRIIYYLLVFYLFSFTACKEDKLYVVASNRNGKHKTEHYLLKKNDDTLLVIDYSNIDSSIVALSILDSSYNQHFDFYSNGNLRLKALTNGKGELNGPAYFFYEKSGYLWTSYLYKNDLKIGSGLEYHDSTDLIKSIFHYNNEGQLYYRKSFDRQGNFIKEEGSR